MIVRYLTIAITLVGSIIFISCEKEEKTIHSELIVPDNKAKDYSGIPSILIENYVSKIYIDLIGEKPSDSDKETAVSYLKDNNLSEAAREKVISDVIALNAYHDRLFQINVDLLLNGMGRDEIQEQYDLYEFIRDDSYNKGDTFTGQFIDYEVQKLGGVLSAQEEYKSNSITLSEYFERLSFNLIYDEINMGSENFVKACFENYFKRSPTESELENGVTMTDGQPSFLLQRDGRTKIDFLKITTEDVEFYQGRVLDSYRTLLLREPTSEEMTELTNLFSAENNYADVQTEIVKTDEYAGFE